SDEKTKGDKKDVQLGDSPPSGRDLTQPPGINRVNAEGKIQGLSFRDALVNGFVPFIQEWTGKAVLLKSQSISTQKITLVDTRELTKHQALDLIFTAFRLNDIAVVELPSIIFIVGQTELPKIPITVVLGPDQDPLALTEEGVFVTKVFKLKNTKAADIGDRL